MVSGSNIQDDVVGDDRSKLAKASASELLDDPSGTAGKISFRTVRD